MFFPSVRSSKASEREKAKKMSARKQTRREHEEKRQLTISPDSIVSVPFLGSQPFISSVSEHEERSETKKNDDLERKGMRTERSEK